ncbi:MAG: hypothetical protein E6J40_15115, partial [Chloroflexi bacterium]
MNAEAHAQYALFLNYRTRFAAARAEAERAGALDARDGRVAAILCRVDDWSQMLAQAVTAGRDAIRLAPRDPLAHLFLAEALADSGETAAAQREIGAASALISAASSAYLRAELHREQANLEGDRGDGHARVGAFQAARDAQPGWLYRSVEL